MPTGVFPYIGSYGYSWTWKSSEVVHEWPDGSYRRLLLASGVLGEIDLTVTDVSKTVANSIKSFWKSHKQANAISAQEFYFYDPDVVDAAGLDLTGVSSTGRLVGLFMDPQLTWSRSGRCRFNFKIKMKVVGTV